MVSKTGKISPQHELNLEWAPASQWNPVNTQEEATANEKIPTRGLLVFNLVTQSLSNGRLRRVRKYTQETKHFIK